MVVAHTPIHPDGGRPINRVRRLNHEFELADYSWDPETGVGSVQYENLLGEVKMQSLDQPASRKHVGWRWFTGRYT